MEGSTATVKTQDEFEMIIGEIPNASSENSQIEADERGMSQVQKGMNSSASSNSVYLYDSPRISKQGGDMAFYGSLNFANHPYVEELQSDGNVVNRLANREELNLPDDQSLTSALENLSIEHSIAEELIMQPSIQYNKRSHLNGLWFDGQYLPSVNKHSSFDSVDSSIPQKPNPLDGLNTADQTLQAYSSMTRNGIDIFSSQVNCQMDKADKLTAHELRQKPESLSGGFRDLCHGTSMYTGDMSFMPGMRSFHFVSNVSFPGAELPSSTVQQQCYFEKPPTYMQYQDLSHPCISREDQYLMMSQKHCYVQQCQNQELHRLPNCNNPILHSLNSKPMAPYFHSPILRQNEWPNQDHCWSGGDLEWGENQQNLSLTGSGSCRYRDQGFTGKGENIKFSCPKKQSTGSGRRYSGKESKWVQGFNNVGKQIFPEKILTRSTGSKSLRIPKSTHPTSSELVNRAIFQGKVSPNSQVYPTVQVSSSFQADGGAFSSDDSHRRLTSESSQPKYDSVDEVVGRIYSESKDQLGCRFLQEKLEKGTFQDVCKIFVEIISHIVELMTDPFGNYLVQKLLCVCNEDQKMQIIRKLSSKSGELIRISCDVYGTRVIQKVIEILETEEQVSMIISLLKPAIIPLIKDGNGNHVVQLCLQHLAPEISEFLFDEAIAHCVELAKDCHGCCVLQKCLSHLTGQQRERLMSVISSNALVLSQDQFGNYVVQFLLGLKVPSATEDILDRLKGNFVYLSVQKYSSHVVQRCLEFAREDHLVRIIRELITDPRLLQILQDRFGNYVIQSAIEFCKGGLYAALEKAIRPHIPVMQSNPFGKKVLSRLSRKK